MIQETGQRRHRPDDPTDEPTSDPVPTGEDVVHRHRDGHDTPRKYDEPVEEKKSESARPAAGSD